jgi:DNA-binding NarL/FixJ family response regulator
MSAVDPPASPAAALGLGAVPPPVRKHDTEVAGKWHQSGLLPIPVGRLVAVLGDVRLLSESIALVLRAASMRTVVIDLDPAGQEGSRPDAVVLAIRQETVLDGALELVGRLWPGPMAVVLVSPGIRNTGRALSSTIKRLEIGAPVESLVRAISGALRGTPANATVAAVRRDSGPQSLLDFLTPREREVLRHLAAGYSAAHIAARLDIAENTVRTHLANIRSKLGVRSRLEAVRLVHSHAEGSRPS